MKKMAVAFIILSLFAVVKALPIEIVTAQTNLSQYLKPGEEGFFLTKAEAQKLIIEGKSAAVYKEEAAQLKAIAETNKSLYEAAKREANIFKITTGIATLGLLGFSIYEAVK